MNHLIIRHLAAAPVLASALIGVNASAITFTEPAYDFGSVTSYAVTVDRSHSSGYNYAKLLTFSLAADADIRIDMRATEQAYKYVSATFALYSPTFSLYDQGHQLLGTSVDDPTFAQSDGNGCTFTVCRFNDGVTLSTSLRAGTYAIEFSGTVGGYSTPNLHFGVSKTDAATINAYLKALTPLDAVPEPGTWATMGLGLVGLMALTRRQRRARA